MNYPGLVNAIIDLIFCEQKNLLMYLCIPCEEAMLTAFVWYTLLQVHNVKTDLSIYIDCIEKFEKKIALLYITFALFA